MKSFQYKMYCSFLLLMASLFLYSQSPWIDPIKKKIHMEQADTNLVKLLISVAEGIRFSQPDTCLLYVSRALVLAEKLHYDEGILWSTVAVSSAYYVLGDFTKELEYTFRLEALSERIHTAASIGYAKGELSDCYYNLGEYDSAMHVWRQVVKIAEDSVPDELHSVYNNSSHIFSSMGQYDSAMLYVRKAWYEFRMKPWANNNDYGSKITKSNLAQSFGEAFAGLGKYDSAFYEFNSSLSFARFTHMQINEIDACIGLATLYLKKNNPDSAIWYATQAVNLELAKSYHVSMLKAANLLAAAYETKARPDSALKYLHLATSLKDSLFNRRKTMNFQRLLFAEHEKQNLAVVVAAQVRDHYRIYLLIIGFVILLAAAGLIIVSRRRKQIQDMRNNIADDLHDDIGSALSSISIMSVLAKDRPGESFVLLDAISENTAIIQENMSDIVWAVNPKNDRFENVTRRMNEFAADILEAKNIALEFRCDPSLSDAKLTMGQRKNFYLFFKETINNAAKYSGASKVIVCICQKDHHIEMIITDDGKGFDSERVFNGNGMTTLRKRGTELQAAVNIVSKIQEGTAVQLKFRIT